MFDLYAKEKPGRREEKIFIGLVAALAILNGLDLLSTKIAIDHGASEGWWISEWLFDHSMMYPAKIGVVFWITVTSLLMVSRKELTVRKIYMGFFITGFYGCVIMSNTIVYFRKYA